MAQHSDAKAEQKEYFPLFLLTDFGTKDPYVGLMKAQALSIYPAARLVDLSHDMGQGNLQQASFWLKASLPYLPRQSVCVAVVDPTVGSQRRALVVAYSGRFFVAPDNGLLSWLIDEAEAEGEALYAFHLDRKKLTQTLPQLPRRVGTTFDGRDLFAPVGAWIAGMLPLEEPEEVQSTLKAIGHPLSAHELVRLTTDRAPTLLDETTQQPQHLSAKIEVVDHFGNLITSLKTQAHFKQAQINIDGRPCRWVDHYAEGADGELLALRGSFGTLEIAIKNDSADQYLSQSRPKPALKTHPTHLVELRWSED